MVSSLLDKTWIFVFGSSELKLWQDEKGIVSNAELQRSEIETDGRQREFVYCTCTVKFIWFRRNVLRLLISLLLDLVQVATRGRDKNRFFRHSEIILSRSSDSRRKQLI